MIYGISGKKQTGKDTVAKIWQYLLDYNSSGYAHPITEQDFNSYIENKHNLKSNWEKKSFANKLKQILCILTGCTMEQLEDEEFKNSRLPEEWTVYKLKVPGIIDKEVDHNKLFTTELEAEQYLTNVLFYNRNVCKINKHLLTYREALQFIGTDLFRDKFHSKVWVNSLFSDYKPQHFRTVKVNGVFSHQETMFPNWLISDVRFPDEVEAIKERNGKVIRVEKYRGGYYSDLPSDSSPLEHFKRGVEIHKSETELDNYKDWDYIIYNDGSIEDLINKVKEITIKERVINEI